VITLPRALVRRAFGVCAVAVLVVAGVVACAPDTITRPVTAAMQAPTGANRNVTPSKARTLTVCTGDGPAGTYTYQLSNIVLGAGTRGTLSLPLGTTFSVPSGGCVDAAMLTFPSIRGETDVPTSITVTQVGRPAGTNFKYIQDTELELQTAADVCMAPANFPCGLDKQVFSPSTASVINEFHGSVLAYFHDWGSLGDFVWSDTNGNGIQDAGEPGISGLTVTLTGPVSATAVTGANGEYSFMGLSAGTYTVSVATPAGLTPSPVLAAGSLPATDSDGSGATVTLAAGEANPTIDFGFVPPRFVLGDRVWSDTNGDGVQDAGEAGINGVTVTISGPGGYTATTTTVGDGIYAFNNLLGGTYTVCTTSGIPAGDMQTYDLDGLSSPNCATVTVGPSTTAVDFGYKPPRFSLGDRVWTDVNGNGAQDAGEAGITGVTVTITGTGGFSATTTTAADGIYGFSDLLAGTYTVCTTAGIPAGDTQTYDLDGVLTPNCATVVLATANRNDVDFGYTPPRYAIGDRVWNDVNGNGVQEAGESGLNGVTITISGLGGFTGTAVTAGDGIYAFGGLLAGPYTVCTTTGLPAGYTQTYDLDGVGTPNCTAVTVGPSTTAVDFGYQPPRFSVGDRVWSDANGNGIQDAGEAGLTGVTVAISGPGGYSATTTTGANGMYGFSGLLAGSYTVCTTAGIPSGYSETYDLDGTSSPNCATITVGPSTTDVDFGYTAPRFSVGDRVWNDVNGNGVQDAGEAGLNGVTVTISGSGGFTGTAVTAGDGMYAFSNLLAGTYTVCTMTGLPVGYTQTYDLDGVGTPNCATMTVGPSTTAVDFGYTAPRFSVGDRVWNDANGNGVQDAGEVGINGVTVMITGAGGYTATTTTAGDGTYSLGNLLAGTYTVCTTAGVPSGYTPTYDLDGTATPNCAAVTVGPSTTAVDFGYKAPSSASGFTTFTQGGWGAKPAGNNPGKLLLSNFATVYPGGSVTIGGTKTLKFTSASAITAFLPQGGTPSILTASATNASSSSAGVFAGQVLALRLSVDFSNAGVEKPGLASLKVKSGKLAGLTVSQVLAMANAVLGGNTGALPAGVSISDLNSVVDAINNNYDNGTTNNGYLVP
jgi:hypothetical protein